MRKCCKSEKGQDHIFKCRHWRPTITESIEPYGLDIPSSKLNLGDFSLFTSMMTVPFLKSDNNNTRFPNFLQKDNDRGKH